MYFMRQYSFQIVVSSIHHAWHNRHTEQAHFTSDIYLVICLDGNAMAAILVLQTKESN
jgi:hypothetical protein